MRQIFAAFMFSAVTVAAFTGCKPDLIPGTSVEDTQENRDVLGFLVNYQIAMQAKKVDDVLKLCAADYYETNGNDKPEDDYNKDGLRERLEKHFARTKELTLEVYVQQIERNDDTGVIGVAYRYNTRALVNLPAGEKWLTATEVNKIKLRKIDDDNDELGFRIIAGL